jgi:hypothetical protein
MTKFPNWLNFQMGKMGSAFPKTSLKIWQFGPASHPSSFALKMSASPEGEVKDITKFPNWLNFQMGKRGWVIPILLLKNLVIWKIW